MKTLRVKNCSDTFCLLQKLFARKLTICFFVASAVQVSDRCSPFIRNLIPGLHTFKKAVPVNSRHVPAQKLDIKFHKTYGNRNEQYPMCCQVHGVMTNKHTKLKLADNF